MNAAIHKGPGRAWAGRIEDDALLRGLGRYGDDLRPAGAVAAAFVRSPHGFADIVSINKDAALMVDGVLAVLTAADLAGARYHSITHGHPIPGRGGSQLVSPHRPALAENRVMHVGEPVALVVAETAALAEEAAALIAVEYEAHAAVTEARDAARPGAPQLWPDQAPGNLAFDWEAPADLDGSNKIALDRIFARAAHVVRIDVVNQRILAASLEPRVATAIYDARADMFTVQVGTQGVTGVRMQICAAMGLNPEQVRVINEDVGGGFGMKASGYPEYVALLHAAKQIGRPVHWVCGRSESCVSDNQARDSDWHAELALEADGRFLGLRVTGIANLGAYTTGVGHFCSTVHVSGCLPTVYHVPRASVATRLYFTNTVPTGPYRGAGRPEANYVMERLVDQAARQLKMDPAELRRRNLIQPAQVPYRTPFGNVYDSGDFPAVLEKALHLADYAGFPARRAASAKAGKHRGIGIGCFLEIAGAMPDEMAGIVFPGGACLEVSIGATPQGQGHRTVFRALAARQLGLPVESVTVTHGDSTRDVPGFGAVASRSAFMIGSAVVKACDEVVAKGRMIAALLLQADAASLEYRAGSYYVGESGRSISLFDVAERSGELLRQGVIKDGLDTRSSVKIPSTFPNGCHIAEVEIDAETGAPTIVNYVAVNDSGHVLDQMIVDGQIHGGVAQGLGQALTEAAIYEAGGQFVTGSLMDYAMPRADLMPPLTTVSHATPCKTNPLGVKGTGEAGTTAAPCALLNAIMQALPEGAPQVEMPATADRIWSALRARA